MSSSQRPVLQKKLSLASLSSSKLERGDSRLCGVYPACASAVGIRKLQVFAHYFLRFRRSWRAEINVAELLGSLSIASESLCLLGSSFVYDISLKEKTQTKNVEKGFEVF